MVFKFEGKKSTSFLFSQMLLVNSLQSGNIKTDI